MIDTVRIRVRLGEDQEKLIKKFSKKRMYNDAKGEIGLSYYDSISLPPYGYQLNYMTESRNSSILYIEGSLPKIWYGENVHLIYLDELRAISELIFAAFYRRFGGFPPIDTWRLHRVDVVYAWKYQSEQIAKQVIEYAMDLQHNMKSKHFYGDCESVVFGNKERKMITFYRKYPEFKKKGYRKIYTSNFLFDNDEVLKLSEGVVRFEVMLRAEELKKYFDTVSYITFDHFLKTEESVKHLLIKNLSTLKGSVNYLFRQKKAMYQSLLSVYKKPKATRLFCFFNSFYPDIKIRRLIERYDLSSDLSEQKKDIKNIIGVLPTYLKTTPFDFSIPSPIVVNPPPNAREVKQELVKRLELIHDHIDYIEGNVVEPELPI